MEHIINILITFVAASIVATIVLNILFRKSIFMQIAMVWVINVFLTVINSKIHFIFPDTYTYPIALITGLSFTSVLLLVVSKWVRNPLKSLVSDIQAISKGNLNTSKSISFNKKYRGEFKELKNSIKNLTDKFSFSISSISHSAETVNKMGKDSCNMASALTNDTSEQASSIQEISASMEEMNANINSTYENALKTQKSTELTNRIVNESANAVNELNKAMLTIVSKIKVINEIATQTNLLALNASIEAKQAGEAGKGFSVVAGEIKKLAEISKTAAEEINNISTANLSLSEQVNIQMKETIPYIDQTLDLMHEISTASQELKSGSDQITSAMNNINHSTQSKSKMSDDLNKNSEKLESEASLLIDSISFFKL